MQKSKHGCALVGVPVLAVVVEEGVAAWHLRIAVDVDVVGVAGASAGVKWNSGVVLGGFGKHSRLLPFPLQQSRGGWRWMAARASAPRRVARAATVDVAVAGSGARSCAAGGRRG